jgi:hypothetical protein
VAFSLRFHTVFVTCLKGGEILLYAVLFVSTIVTLALVYFLSREVRMRRALQLLLAKLLSNWRNNKSHDQ